jgi:hypothetical protein
MSAGVEVDVGSAVVEYRSADGESLTQRAEQVSLSALFAAAPWRTFRWYEGQRHYSGKYWAVTEADHVIYESRLELSALLMADFDLAVQNIKAQPFRLWAFANGRMRSHVPDYLLRTDVGPLVIDVVRSERLEQPKIQTLCAWTKRGVESLSWRYEVVCEQPPDLLANVRFLAGCRREQFINATVLEHLRLRTDDLAGSRVDDAIRRFGCDYPKPLVRSALTHMLWRQELIVDLAQPFQPSTILEVRK